MKTFSAKAETVERDWFVVDANGKTLGRLGDESSIDIKRQT
jgi:large subunit ribosomal protein L13